jgi:molecular chaperone DnaK (HSP70)
MTRDLLERTETTTSLVIKQAGLQWPQIDRVLLVGGSSRMPMVGRMLRKVTGQEPDCSQSPDEAVAHGAALYAGMLLRKRTSAGGAECRLINVNSHSLGVVGIHASTKRETNVVLIPKNTALPYRVVRTFRTARDSQRSVKVRIVEGESDRPEACLALGECIVRDLPPGLPKNTPVEVEYAYHANGRISVSARVPSIRYSQRVEIERETAQNLCDLNVWRARLCGQAEPPADEPAASTATEPMAHADLLKQLDALYLKVGNMAVKLPLPEPLRRSQQTAVAAAAERNCAQTQLQAAESARQASVGSDDLIRLDARLAQARTELQQSQVRADFAHLVLGRDCVNAGFEPPQAWKHIAEIRRLRR